MDVDLDQAVAAVADAAARLVALMRAVRHPDAIAIGEWTSADVACHIAHAFERHVEGVLGRGFPNETLAETAAYNASYLKLDRERDPKVLAEKVEHQTAEFHAAASGRSGDEPVPYIGGVLVARASVAGILLSETELHGLDIARAEGMPWTIPPRHAAIAIEAQAPLLPSFVNESEAAGFAGNFDLRIRGGSRLRLEFAGGRLAVEREERGTGDDRRVDCRISADPVAFLLLAYGRTGRWGPVLTGKVVAYGRKPWLGLKLNRLLKAP